MCGFCLKLLVFCSRATPVPWWCCFALIVSNASLVKWTHNKNNNNPLCPPGLQKYILTCEINSVILLVSLCWDALAVRSMACIWAVAFPVVSAFSQRQGFVLVHVSCVSMLQGNWSSNASELLKAFWVVVLTFYKPKDSALTDLVI